MRRGHNRERDVRDLLEGFRWVCVRAAGSLGPIDVVAIGGPVSVMPEGWAEALNLDPGRMVVGPNAPLVVFIEVKSTGKTPYEHFGPAARDEARQYAKDASAHALLAYWPKCKPGQAKLDALRWIWEYEWPR